MQSLSYVILMCIVLLIGLAFNCVIVPSLVGLVCLCSVVPLLLNLVDEVTSALHERPFQEVAERYTRSAQIYNCTHDGASVLLWDTILSPHTHPIGNQRSRHWCISGGKEKASTVYVHNTDLDTSHHLVPVLTREVRQQLKSESTEPIYYFISTFERPP